MKHATRWLTLVALAALAPGGPAQAAPSPSPSAVREKTAEVFDRPEFKSADTNKSTWLLRVLGQFFLWLGTLYEVSRGLFWLLLIGCVVILLAILAHIVFTIRKVFVGGGLRGERGRGHAERMLLSVSYREEANRRAAAGDYTEAVRFLFLSLVYRFDEAGRVSLHKAYTNREYLQLLGDRTPARDALRVMVDTLDDHWYGQRACDVGQYQACLAVYERLVAGV
jgi:hypothetical protein